MFISTDGPHKQILQVADLLVWLLESIEKLQ